MLKMRAERWVLLATALAVTGGLGCGRAPAPKDTGEISDPSQDDDGADDSAADDANETPVKDSGTSKKDASARPPTPGGKTDAGPAPSGSKDAGVAKPPDMTEDEDAATSEPPPAGGDRILPPVDDVNMKGPFATTIDTKSDFVTFRPTDLGKDGLKHPVFIWGTGSGALPERYNDHFNMMASHGFVIVSPNKTQKSASDMKAALDWILAENKKDGSPYFGKLDPDRVGMGGHSQGSTSTFDAEANETRIKTSIHIAGGSFDGAGSSKVKTPTAYICGETDFALENCKRDWMNVKDKQTFFSVLKGVDHVQCARSALPGMIAWLRWHLAGETERAAMFTGPDGEFFKGIWVSETKNWK